METTSLNLSAQVATSLGLPNGDVLRWQRSGAVKLSAIPAGWIMVIEDDRVASIVTPLARGHQ